MTGRRAIVGLCMLCALALSAFAAQGASAETKGTTAFTCKKGPGGTGVTYKTEHCRPGDATGEYSHFAVPEGVTTEVTVTNDKTNAETNGPTIATLKATVAGSVIELTATGTHAEGWMENAKEKEGANAGEHYIYGVGSTTYTGVTESRLGCEVFGASGGKGVIETNPLAGTSTGQGDFGSLVPSAGTEFAHFELKNCAVAGTYKVVGSIKCKPEGATINCNHEEVTTQGTLHIGSALGPVAGVDVRTTFKGRASAAEPYTPLSATTVSTP